MIFAACLLVLLITAKEILKCLAFIGNDLVERAGTDVRRLCDGNNSPIYCYGRLPTTVNDFRHTYPERTELTLSALKKDPAEVLRQFELNFPQTHTPVTEVNQRRLTSFMKNNFDQPPYKEVERCALKDWTKRPKKLLKIKDSRCRDFALKINDIWKALCAKTSEDVRRNPDRHSLLYVPHEFIRPGDRFKEFYYWDTFWIIKGLIVSGMLTTARGQIRNLASMVERFGFVPNGGRVYYLGRSQPPFLTLMVEAYFNETNDKQFLQEMLPVLDKELMFWNKNRRVDVRLPDQYAYTVYQYRAQTNDLSPDPWGFGAQLIANISNETRKRNILQNKHTACESGMDYSSRWTVNHAADLRELDILNIAPVDLNTVLCYSMRVIQSFYELFPDSRDKATYYRHMHDSFVTNFTNVFYNSTTSIWHDWNILTQKHQTQFDAAVGVPLYAPCGTLTEETRVYFYNYLQASGALNYRAGVPTTLNPSGQQWDFPNAWPPHNHMIIESLRAGKTKRLQSEAFRLAQKYVSANYDAFQASIGGPHCAQGCMFEKIDCRHARPPEQGKSVYPTQIGFGWTNGVVLDLMHTYANRMRCPPGTAEHKMHGHHAFLVLAVVFTCIAAITVTAVLYRRHCDDSDQANEVIPREQYHLVDNFDNEEELENQPV